MSSKVGDRLILIPATVTVEMAGQQVTVKGKEGSIKLELPRQLSLKRDGENLVIERRQENISASSLHGLFRTLIFNAVQGVEKPWEKRLEIVGTGFNVKLQGEDLVLKLGFSHQVVFKKPEAIKFAVQGNNKIIVMGVDKQLVGEVAYQIKKIRKPDVYKGKGIRYEGEKVRIKPGKKAKTTTGSA
jgi:large subunit ribosomal protein L6